MNCKGGCKNYEQNLKNCPCTYEPCSKKGYCCECLRYHLSLGELPACFFPPEVERTYDRSIRKFVEIHGGKL
ncbi:MAG: hypothetical protein DRQ10_02085 [Candidatus Hydrothermota bacterium]|nr:MAG: hypothetical protein DRQ10_02085 [Candidatus Hydrothermae bacterium]